MKKAAEDAEERVAIAGIINGKIRHRQGRIIVDCLTLTVSAQQQAEGHLELSVRLRTFRIKTIGVGNVSFGLLAGCSINFPGDGARRSRNITILWWTNIVQFEL